MTLKVDPFVIYEPPFTLRGATEVILQRHQILRLPRKMLLMIAIILLTYETTFSMCGAPRLTLQPHQILRLPRKMALLIDPARI